MIQQQEGALLQDILDRRGVPYFLDAEERAIVRSPATTMSSPRGSSWCCREGPSPPEGHGPVIYLRVPLEELKSRIHNMDPGALPWSPVRLWKTL